jgi:hypothetical protein
MKADESKIAFSCFHGLSFIFWNRGFSMGYGQKNEKAFLQSRAPLRLCLSCLKPAAKGRPAAPLAQSFSQIFVEKRGAAQACFLRPLIPPRSRPISLPPRSSQVPRTSLRARMISGA